MDPDVQLTLNVLVAARRERIAAAGRTSAAVHSLARVPARGRPSPQATAFTSPVALSPARDQSS